MASSMLKIISSGGIVVRNMKRGTVYGGQGTQAADIYCILRIFALTFSCLACFKI